MELVSLHLQNISDKLLPGTTLQSNCFYITGCLEVVRKYGRALHEIVPIFTYLNRVYITPILHSNLEDQLLNLFKMHIIDKHAERLVGAMKNARKVSFSVEPSVMAELAQALYSMKPNLRVSEADFFSHYIAQAKSSTKPMSLEEDIEATRKMQLDLQRDPNFSFTCSQKRSKEDTEIEDEECSSSLLSSLLMGSS
ncbi:CDK2-associated and cullin domain-containing protein 1 [Ciona intestinalis]